MFRRTASVLLVLTVLGCPVAAEPILWSLDEGGNDHCYEPIIVSGGITWNAANDAAIAAGGHLATITSAAEMDFVFSLVNSQAYWNHPGPGHSNYGPWLGGFQPAGSPEPEGNWQWVTGELFDYTNWATDQPNESQNANEDSIHLWASGGGTPPPPRPVWNDLPAIGSAAAQPVSYVVEYVPEPSTLGLLAMAVVGLFVYRLRRRCS
ncbi:MAG: PEP-CTERM sorting domain-containing protein [Pirellulales bacterium]|nr:PEP-CTERM sorting domain-containing protein [Pirellulales bacterium]